MISNPFFLVSILISAWITFFSAAFVVETILHFISISHYRLRATLRLLPYISLSADLAFSKFSTQHWLNPLSCISCVQKFILQFLFPDLWIHLNTNEISLLRHLGKDYSHSFYTWLFITFSTVTVVFILRMFFQLYTQWHWLYSIGRNGIDKSLSTNNTRLAFALKQRNVRILLSEDVCIPMATFSNTIVIPQNVVKIVSKDELEAIIAHELEHLNWKDPLSRSLAQLMGTMFWWVPTQFWFKKTELDQEMASDQSVLKYKFAPELLASALFKVTKLTKIMNQAVLCPFADKKHSSLSRLQAILGIRPISQKKFTLLKLIAIILLSTSIPLCTLWL